MRSKALPIVLRGGMNVASLGSALKATTSTRYRGKVIRETSLRAKRSEAIQNRKDAEVPCRLLDRFVAALLAMTTVSLNYDSGD